MFPRLETRRLILTEMEETDCVEYEEGFADWEVIRLMSKSIPWPYPEGSTDEWFRSDVRERQGLDRWVWVIRERDGGALAGCVDLWRTPSPENRGMWVARRFWGLGYGTEAAEAANEAAFSVLGFERLYFLNNERNTASGKMKSNTGARLIGTHPSLVHDSDSERGELWVMERDEWMKNSHERGKIIVTGV